MNIMNDGKAPKVRNNLIVHNKGFAPNGAQRYFIIVYVYKGFAPNGAQWFVSIVSFLFVLMML